MAIDDVLEGLDPYDLMAAEADRIAAFAESLDAAAWSEPSACEGWTRHDLLAHLDATEDYFHAGMAGTVADYLRTMAANGATDVSSGNRIGVEERRDRAPASLLAHWRAANAETVAGMRALDGGDIDTSIGAYPCRWQAFHVAGELATHADDLGVPVTDAERTARLDWRVRFALFSVREAKADLHVERGAGTVRITDDAGLDVTLDEETFVHAVEARLPAASGVDPALAAKLSTMP